jgi:hypothetical protein
MAISLNWLLIFSHDFPHQRRYMHIARNRFWNGGTTHWGISWKQSIYEDNVATGASTTAMG